MPKPKGNLTPETGRKSLRQMFSIYPEDAAYLEQIRLSLPLRKQYYSVVLRELLDLHRAKHRPKKKDNA